MPSETPTTIQMTNAPIAVPEIRMYWHGRHDDEPPHRWLRNQILEAVTALGFRDAADAGGTGD